MLFSPVVRIYGHTCILFLSQYIIVQQEGPKKELETSFTHPPSNATPDPVHMHSGPTSQDREYSNIDKVRESLKKDSIKRREEVIIIYN